LKGEGQGRMRKPRAITHTNRKWKPAFATLGLEITDRAVKIAEVAGNKENQFRLTHYAIEPLSRKAVEDGRIIDSHKVVSTLQTMLAKLNIRTKKVHLVLPSQLIMVRFLKLPDIPINDLKKLIDFEVKNNIHLPFDQPYYDFLKMNGTQEKGSRFLTAKPAKSLPQEASLDKKMEEDSSFLEAAPAQQGGSLGGLNLFDREEQENQHSRQEKYQCDVMLVASPLELIEEYAAVVQSAGLTALSIEFKALSLYRIIEKTSLIPAESTFVVVDINDYAVDLSIFHTGQLKITRNIPMNFQELQDGGQQDQIGLLLQFSDPKSQLLDAVSELSSELERLMNFFRYSLNNRNQEFDHIVVSGDLETLPEIISILKDRFSQQIIAMHTPAIQSDVQEIEHVFPSIAVPIGLALRGKRA
jgi:Tfp pilus assembly PilM family ATPase